MVKRKYINGTKHSHLLNNFTNNATFEYGTHVLRVMNVRVTKKKWKKWALSKTPTPPVKTEEMIQTNAAHNAAMLHINTYDYIITLIKRRKKNIINFMIIYCFFIWNLTQECFVSSLVEIGPVVLEKKIFKSYQFIFINSRLSPLCEGRGPSFEQTWIPYTQGYMYFVPSLVEIGPVVLDKKMKMWKVFRQTDGRTDGRTDDGRQVIRKAHLSF